MEIDRVFGLPWAFADGDKQRDEAPTGANLRRTRIDDATIAETIRCGRPGAGMPSFGEDAYTPRGCYGQPAGPVPDDLYPGRASSAPRKSPTSSPICAPASSAAAR